MEPQRMTFLDDCAHAIAAELQTIQGDGLDDWHDHLAVEWQEQQAQETRQPEQA